MGSINPSSARITALYKYYHTDRTKFFSAASTMDEYPDEIYAVTEHSAYRSGSATPNHNAASIVRLIQSSLGVWKTMGLKDPGNVATVLAITSNGTAYYTGDFQRLGNNTFYNHYDTNWNNNGVYKIRARTSAQDTAANLIYKAGIPNPNANLIIDRMDDKSAWYYFAGVGVGSAANDRSPLHKFFGVAGVMFTQETSNATSTITFTVSSTVYPTGMNISTFSDGTSISGKDYIEFTVFRFTKNAIGDLRIEIGSGGFTGTDFYYWAPITMTPTATLRNPEDASEWDAYSFKQNTIMSEWGLNPYDHQLFKVRIKKNSFAWSIAKGANTGWANIKNVRFTMKGNLNASSVNPAKVTINNLRVAKAPPTPKPYRVQWAAFEAEEDGSTLGWRATASGTTLTFNYHLAREGCSCIEIPQAGGAQCPVLSIDYNTARDFVTFADGVVAGPSYTVKMDLFTGGFGAANTGLTLATWTRPSIKFITGGSGSANYYQLKFGIGSTLRGGGITRQVKFVPDGGGEWSKGGAGCTWTSVDRIEIFGQFYGGKTLLSYFMDNLRIERPSAIKPINIFEPIDLLALDASDYLAEQYLGNNAAGVWDAATDVITWWFKFMKYRTHGMGYAVYPDYEHSSIGIASLRLVTTGSKPFGMTIEVDPTKWPNPALPASDLSQFWIPTLTTSFKFDWPTQFGFLKYEAIAADDADEFSIWIAAQDPNTVSEIVIKLHGAGGVGGNRSDPNNFWEYRISGAELYAKMKDQKDKEKEYKQLYDATRKAIKNFKKGGWKDLANFYLNPDNQDTIKEFLGTGINYLGRDRGGWPAAMFKWRRKDMLLQRMNFLAAESEGTAGTPVWTDIRGHTFEVIGTGGKCEVCFDNFFLKTKGALKGTYYYKMMLEDEDGYLSPATEPSEKVQVEDQDIQLENIYVPGTSDRQVVPSKRIYRLGGTSTEWRHVSNIDVLKTSFADNKPDQDLGMIIPPDAYAPPQAKVMKAIGNCMYYGNVRTRFNEVLPYRIYKSEPYCPYRVSEFDETDLSDTQGAGITAIEGYYNHLAIWTSDAMHTCDLALSTPPIYRSGQGCIAKRSVAISDLGLIWLSRNGLMIGDISKVDDNFFRPINILFEDYTENQLSSAIGFVRGQYYYLFYDQDSAIPKGICCYLPERLFSELRGNALNVFSVALARGGGDNDIIYYGRGLSSVGTTVLEPGIFQMFDGMTDNLTSITTVLRSKDFTDPGIMYDKYLAAHYMVAANMYSSVVTNTNTTTLLTVNAYCNQTAVDTMLQISAAPGTALKSFANRAIQGDWGQLLGFGISGTNRHKITELALKIEPEPDTEYHV